MCCHEAGEKKKKNARGALGLCSTSYLTSQNDSTTAFGAV